MGMSLGFPDNHDSPYPKPMEDARSRVLAACKASKIAFLNHPNFSPPAVNIAQPATFGFITNTIGNPRNIEFGLKFYF